MGVTATFATDSKPGGAFTRLNSAPGGLSSSLQFLPSGVTRLTAPDGTATTTVETADPQYGMLAPLRSVTTILPSNLVRTEAMTRSITRVGNALATLTETTTLNGNSWTRTFDVASRTWTSTSPLGRQSTLAVDAAGRETGVTIPGIADRVTQFDARGRVSALMQGVRSSAFGYFSSADATNGYLQSVTDPLGQTRSYTRDPLGRTLSEIAADNGTTRFGWDASSNLTSVAPPDQPAHLQSYNHVNLLTQYTPPPLASLATPETAFDYDLDRNLTRVTRPDGKVLDYTYDTDGRLTAVNTAAGVVTRAYTSGHLETLSSSADGVTLKFAFDGPLQNRVTWSGSVTGTVGWQFNADFRAQREFVLGIQPGISNAYFGYDRDGFLTCASPSSCEPGGADALLLTRSLSNGLLTSTLLGTVADALTYNAFGELASETVASGNTPLFAEVYDDAQQPRDGLGRITRKTETLQGSVTTTDYGYDAVGRLHTVTQGDAQNVYNYDANGNRLSVVTPEGTVSGTYDAQDRLLTYGTLSYAYSPNGELLSKTDSRTGDTTGYAYDVFGNLKRVELPNGDVIEYLVDGLNRRVAKKKNGAFVSRWLYRDELHPVEELDGAGNQLKRFVYGSGKNSPDFMVQAGVEYRILSDQLGSPRLVVDASSGVVAQRMRHDEFGRVLEDTNAGFTPFGFAGGLYDADTGLVRFGARDYDPVVGRWISKDPIIFGGRQANLYMYVGNDPINRHDPLGLYGTNDCSYYDQRCAENGGVYYCEKAPWWCNNLPKPPDPDPSNPNDDEGWFRCVRQCLQDRDRSQHPAPDPDNPSCETPNNSGPWNPANPSWTDHVVCYSECFDDNSYNWF